MIALLRNAAMSGIESRRELELARRQSLDVRQFDQALKMGIIVDVIFVFRTIQISEVLVQSGNYASSAVCRRITVLEVPDIAEDV